MSPAPPSMAIRCLVLLSVIKVTAAIQTTTPLIKVTAAMQTTTPLKCQNDGVSDGEKCSCPDFTQGTRCQTIKDRIELGSSFDVKMEVEFTVNYTYTSHLNNAASQEYREFEMAYNATMTSLLWGLKGHYKITKLDNTNGEVTVGSDVFLTIERYSETLEVSEQYEEKYRKVKTALMNHRCNSSTLCIKSYTMKAIRPPSKRERCGEKISSGYVTFFDPVVSSDGRLTCVSACEPGSPQFLDCTAGSCQIQGEEGPQCFCPNTDTYLYTYSRCQGQVSMAALYGGVGASIGLLVIIGVVLGVFLYRKKKYN